MKQQKYYSFLQQQILIMIGLSLIPGLVYLLFGWIFNLFLPAFLWYISLMLISLYGLLLYRQYESTKMNEVQLKKWYQHLKIFMYLIFGSWVVIFAIDIQHDEYDLHYIAIFTELGASVVASTLLVSDRKLFVPILLTMMLPLSIYFFMIGTWFGYVLSGFSLIFVGVLLYAAFNTNKLLLENYYQAQHDSLTGLYNRRCFMEYTQELVERLEIENKIAYLYLIDLDHFKTINDSLGHDVGDKLLVEVAKRIEAYSKDTHLLARLGGDEFILISKEEKASKEAEHEAYDFASILLTTMRKPYMVEGHELYISASIGVHALSEIGNDTNNFIREVDIAMYEAKSQGRDGVIFFNNDLSLKVERHLTIEQKLYQKLHAKALDVYYQPQFDADENMVGCEALIRWNDDELGVLAPDEFIPIAETTGLILELGFYVLREVFEVWHDWLVTENNVEQFSMNISMRQMLYEPFVREVEALCEHYFSKLPTPPTIIFEVTEHVFSEDILKVIETMNRLKVSGITFSIDDFGTGYSSLSYLQELPIAEVKIDKSFIVEMLENEKSANMIVTIISIAQNFNLKVVGEGVETEAQFERLKEYQCDTFQGFYFEEALKKSDFEKKYLTCEHVGL